MLGPAGGISQLNSSAWGAYGLKPDILADPVHLTACLLASYARKVKTDIPADPLQPAQARVDQLLEALRRETERLTPDVESALTFNANLAE